MEKIMREITNNMYKVHRGTYKAGKWSGNFSETTYLLPGGEWHMHMWGELPKCCHHEGKKWFCKQMIWSKFYNAALLFFADWHECCTSLQFTIATAVHLNW